MMSRDALDCTFLRVFCLGREDEPSVESVVGRIARANPAAYDAALALGPWVEVDPEEVFVTAARPAPVWVH